MIQTPVKTDRRDERGSILIFVVGVLVLLALSATAYLTTARVDRVTTKQNETNTQIDLLLEGCRQLAVARILDDPSIPLDVRVVAPAAVTDPDEYFIDAFSMDKWIGSRVPVATDIAGVPWNGALVNWRFLSRGILPNVFESPTGGNYDTTAFLQTFYYQPTGVTDKPALTVWEKTAAAALVNQGTFLASDADGDGIADAGLLRLPIAPINGITYYAGFRIIDHNSAVNAATAMSRDYDLDTTGSATLAPEGFLAAPIGFFTTGVGLVELLKGDATQLQTQFNALRDYRLGAPNYADVTAAGAAPATYQPYRSLGDKFYHDVARRQDNPVNAAYKTFGINDQMSLSYHFTLPDLSFTSDVETTLANSLRPAGIRTTPYGTTAADITAWYTDFFNYEAENPTTPANNLPRRALLTTKNDQTSLVRGADMDLLDGTYSPAPPDLTTNMTYLFRLKGDTNPSGFGERLRKYHPTDATNAWEPLPRVCSVNTADFPELWRAFWNVMCNPALPSFPENDAPQLHRSWMTNTTYNAQWGKTQQMLLRAAQAAVNLMDLRDADDDITVRELVIRGNDGTTIFHVVVHGTERQPFMTKVVFVEDGSGNAGYAAIELYNPYDTDIVINPATNPWVIGVLNRDPLGYNVDLVNTLPAGTIPAHGFMVVEGGVPPAGVTYGPTAVRVAMPELTTAKRGKLSNNFSRDVLLMRTRLANGTPSTAPNPETPDTYQPNWPESFTAPNIRNLVVVDQMPSDTDPNTTAETIFYKERPTPTYISATQIDTSSAPDWKFVYQDPTAPWIPTTAVVLGAPTTPGAGVGANLPTIQIANTNWPAPTARYPAPPSPPTIVQFPYGGFARLGDVLQVPFIGSATISTPFPPAQIVDLTSVAQDAYYARDAVAGDEGTEDVGRFVSERATYSWANDLFTYFTVMDHPDGNYTPALVRNSTDSNVPIGGTVTTHFNYWTGADPPLTDPSPISGKININTAPFKVLSMLPWMPVGTDLLTFDPATGIIAPGMNTRDDNEDIARAIVYYRDYAPTGAGYPGAAPRQFNHIADLLNVPGMQAARAALLAAMVAAGTEPDDVQGDLTPVNDPSGTPNVDDTRSDFEENALLLTRVSNLITTRSDVFTVYIDLQGWRDAGTANATLAVQRRAAMIVDRSGYTSDTKKVGVTRVPVK